MADQVTIRGLDKLLRKLDHPRHIAAAKTALKAGALHVKGKVAKYPPASQANDARRFNSFFSIATRRAVNTWYERGYGPRWVRRDGSIGGRKTSETLGRKWTTASRNAGLTQVVGNNVSYGIYVQDEDRQAGFHGERGWKTIQKVADDEAERVVEFVKREIDKVLEE